MASIVRESEWAKKNKNYYIQVKTVNKQSRQQQPNNMNSETAPRSTHANSNSSFYQLKYLQ